MLIDSICRKCRKVFIKDSRKRNIFCPKCNKVKAWRVDKDAYKRRDEINNSNSVMKTGVIVKKRYCKFKGCNAVLSQYNKHNKCLHHPFQDKK